jgi:hypothetical protein
VHEKVLDRFFGNVDFHFHGTSSAAFRSAPDANSARSTLPKFTVQQGRKQQPKTKTNTMQNYCKTIGALAAASALVAGNATAEVEYEISTGYSSMYLWRGLDLGDDLVETSLDVATEYNGLDLSAGAWYGSMDNHPAGNNDELDLYGEVAKDLGFATAGLGYIFYNRSEEGNVTVDDSQELYVSLSRDLGFAQAAVAYYWDLEEDNDGYSSLSLSRGFELSQCLTLNTGLIYGYLVEQGQSAHLTAKVALDYAFRENATISPFVAYSNDLNGDNDTLYGAGGLDAKTYVVGGAMLNVKF